VEKIRLGAPIRRGSFTPAIAEALTSESCSAEGLPMRHKCHACKKKFRTEGALAMHARDKHPEREAPIMKQPKSAMLGLVGAFVAGICLGALAMSVRSDLGAGISQANNMVKLMWSR